MTWTLFFQLAMLITLTVVLVGTATESIVKEWKRDE